MTLDSTASLRGIVSAAEGKFEVGTAFLPKPADGGDGGVIIGGASLWLMNNKSEEEQQAAWEFMKYLAEPQTQAYWHVNTGYFPVTTKAYEETLVKKTWRNIRNSRRPLINCIKRRPIWQRRGCHGRIP